MPEDVRPEDVRPEDVREEAERFAALFRALYLTYHRRDGRAATGLLAGASALLAAAPSRRGDIAATQSEQGHPAAIQPPPTHPAATRPAATRHRKDIP